MAEEKKNAQVINGVNDDITELKSLSTLRQRVVSDGEIVSKSANGFRLANGNTGVMLRNDGQNFICWPRLKDRLRAGSGAHYVLSDLTSLPAGLRCLMVLISQAEQRFHTMPVFPR